MTLSHPTSLCLSAAPVCRIRINTHKDTAGLLLSNRQTAHCTAEQPHAQALEPATNRLLVARWATVEVRPSPPPPPPSLKGLSVLMKVETTSAQHDTLPVSTHNRRDTQGAAETLTHNQKHTVPVDSCTNTCERHKPTLLRTVKVHYEPRTASQPQ